MSELRYSDGLRREPRFRRWWRGVGLAARAADVHGRAAERRSGLMTQVQGKVHARGGGAVLWRCVAMNDEGVAPSSRASRRAAPATASRLPLIP